MIRFAILNVPNADPAKFQIVRLSDGKATEPVSISSPETYPVRGRPKSNLQAELRWYLEDFLDYPFSPETEHADRVTDALEDWGSSAFTALFRAPDARAWYDQIAHVPAETVEITISSDNPRILAWPWEALRDPRTDFLGLTVQMNRALSRLADAPAMSETVSGDRLNILLITARPYPRDVGYRTISRPLVELTSRSNFQVAVTVLRPPTFQNLQSHLRQRGEFYHILHFDGHGWYGPQVLGHHNTGKKAVSTGHLIFEDSDGHQDPISAALLSTALHEFRVPIVVLNACQSAMVDEHAQDAFGSVAAALIQAGVRSVVAMAYSLYVSGAAHFLPSFYRSLFNSGSVSAAVRAGRRAMHAEPGRICARGNYPLQDWVVPIVYQEETLSIALAAKKHVPPADTLIKIATPVPTVYQSPHGLIGRDSTLLALERAVQQRPAGILLQGLAGVGKTTAAQGFLAWLVLTDGLGDGAVWLSFNEIRSGESVLDQIGKSIFGLDFVAASIQDKFERLVEHLKKHSHILVWDNFESVRGSPEAGLDPRLSSDDQVLLQNFLQELHGRKTKIVITSRTPEEWLSRDDVSLLHLEGLQHEERWEYCYTILRDLGITLASADSALISLMDHLGGHPLMMRVMLAKLQGQTPAQILADLRRLPVEPDGRETLEEQQLLSPLRFVEKQLPHALQGALAPIALHERFIDLRIVGEMIKASGSTLDFEVVAECLEALTFLGLVRRMRGDIYEVHPALSSYLSNTHTTRNSEGDNDFWRKAFVDIFARQADQLAPLTLGFQEPFFLLHSENLATALQYAKKYKLLGHALAITQSLATYYLNAGELASAAIRFGEMLSLSRDLGIPLAEASAMHQLGIVALRRGEVQVAEQWTNQGLELRKSHRDDAGIASSYFQLARAAENRGDFVTAEEHYRRSLLIHERLGDEDGTALVYHQLGILAQSKWDLPAAETWHKKALAIQENRSNRDNVASTLHQLGIVAQKRGDHAVAEHYYTSSLAIKELSADRFSPATTYHQLGVLAQDRDDWTAARYWHEKSLAIRERFGHETTRAMAYHQLGQVALELGDLSVAEKWYEKGLVINKKYGDRLGIAMGYHQLGMVAHKRKDYSKAEELYTKGLRIKELLKDEAATASSYLQLGQLAIDRETWMIGETFLAKSLEIYQRLGNASGTVTSYLVLGRAAFLQGYFRKAGEWLLQALVVSKSLNDQARTEISLERFFAAYNEAQPTDREHLKEIWEQMGLGSFPPPNLGSSSQ
jgi:tetratricopeptide (TPR) repeat protein